MSNDLPRGWVLSRLADLVSDEPRAITDGPFGSNLKTAHYTDAGPRVIRLQNIGDGVFKREDAHISREHYESLIRHSVQEGDLVVASLGETLPRACLVPSWLPPAIVKADCIRVRLHHEVSAAYVNYALQHPALRRETATKIKGVGRPRLGLKGISDLRIPVAPRCEQERVVAAIEEHFSRLDAVDSALEMAKRRSAHLLECALQAGIRQYSTQESSLASFLTQKLSNGRSVPTANSGGSPVLRLTCLQSGLVNTNETKLGDFSGVDHQKYQIEPDDFLISRGNGSIRLVGIGGLVPANPPPVAFPDTLIRARVDRRRLRPEFLRLIWNSKFVRRQLERQARTTAGIYKVNQTMIGKVSFPTPSPEDQDRLVQELDQVREVVVGLEAEVSLAQGRSRILRRSILADAFSGQLVPQDPNDEPASALLERIAASRR